MHEHEKCADDSTKDSWHFWTLVEIRDTALDLEEDVTGVRISSGSQSQSQKLVIHKRRQQSSFSPAIKSISFLSFCEATSH